MTKTLLATILRMSSHSSHETVMQLLAATLVDGSEEAHACGMNNCAAYETGRVWWYRALRWSSGQLSAALRTRLSEAFASECAKAHEAGLSHCPGAITLDGALELVEGILRPWSWGHFDHQEQLELHG